MNNLTVYDNKVVISSRLIAQELNKEHSKVIRTLEQILTKPNVASLVFKAEYKDKKGELRKEYLLTKDGFTLYMFNIQGYNDFKMAYINRFNEMESQLKTPTLPTIKRLYWEGQPVMTVEMLAKQLDISTVTLNKKLKELKDDNILVGEDLIKFKKENNYSNFCSVLRVINYTVAIKLSNSLNKMNKLGSYYSLDLDKFNLPIQEMKIAVEQAKLLLTTAKSLSNHEIKLKDAIYKTISQILFNIGLWDNKDDIDYNINSVLGWNKLAVIENNYKELKLF